MKIRKSSRAMLLNRENKIYLCKFSFDKLSGEAFLWAAPGGEVRHGETFEETLAREVYSETGIRLTGYYPWVYYRQKLFKTKTGEEIMSEERYYLVKVNHFELSLALLDSGVRDSVMNGKWWSADEIERSADTFFIPGLAARVREASGSYVPSEPVPI